MKVILHTHSQLLNYYMLILFEGHLLYRHMEEIQESVECQHQQALLKPWNQTEEMDVYLAGHQVGA